MAQRVSPSVENFTALPTDAFLGIPAIAQVLGKSPCTIHRRFKNGTLPSPVVVLGRRGLSVGTVRKILAGEV
jgi:predicted DNA-binding transcriptional regulator AlpA